MVIGGCVLLSALMLLIRAPILSVCLKAVQFFQFRWLPAKSFIFLRYSTIPYAHWGGANMELGTRIVSPCFTSFQIHLPKFFISNELIIISLDPSGFFLPSNSLSLYSKPRKWCQTASLSFLPMRAMLITFGQGCWNRCSLSINVVNLHRFELSNAWYVISFWLASSLRRFNFLF